MKFLLVPLLCLAACKTAPPVKPEAPPPEPRALYPLAVGNTWSYDVRGGAPVTVQIVGRDGAWFLDDHRGRLRYDEGGLRDADHYLLRPPLAAGKSWTAVENLSVERFEVTSTEASVVTLAGTFLHCVVVRNRTVVKKDVSLITEWTYAPKVGLAQLVASTVDADGKSTEQSRLTLSSFHLEP